MRPIQSILALWGPSAQILAIKVQFLDLSKVFSCLDFYIPLSLMTEDDMEHEIFKIAPEFLQASGLCL